MKARTVFDCLYESPGPRARRITIGITALSVAALAALCAAVVYRFYQTGQLDGRYWSFFVRPTTWAFLGQGLAGTLESAVISGVMAFLLGFCMMAARISRWKPLRGLATCLIEFTRGVPTLLFIYFFLLGLPALGVQLPPLCKIALPVAISASGVVAEVLRSGVNAVPKGQREAALSLGMRGGLVFAAVVFPQAFRYVIPALIAELVIVVKDTTFAYVVSFPDLMQNVKVLISNYDAMLSVYLMVAVLYIALNYMLNALSTMAARRERSRRSTA